MSKMGNPFDGRSRVRRISSRWGKKIPKLHGKALKFYEHGAQCFCCDFYIPLEGDLGADWGVCTNQHSQSDGSLVFEHHTCLFHKYISPEREEKEFQEACKKANIKFD